MAALSGYNPGISLLPAGGGTIQAMSGGGLGTAPIGFDPNRTLIPAAGGEISAYKGGGNTLAITNNSNTSSNKNAALTLAKQESTKLNTPATNVTGESTNTINIGPSSNSGVVVIDPLTSATNGATNTTSGATNGATNTTSGATNTTSGATNGATNTTSGATNTTSGVTNGITNTTSGVTNTTSGVTNTTSGATNGATTGTTNGETTTTSGETTTGATPNTPNNSSKKPKNGSIDTEEKHTKDIILFGTALTLEDPSKNTGAEFTKSQLEALKIFGLDGPGLSLKEKLDVLQALYDGKCNSDKPLGMLVNCEPVRRIVQSLALNLLSKIEAGDKNTNISKEEKPEVSFDKMGDGSMRVCITFKPNSISLLSKFKIPSNKGNTGKGNNANGKKKNNTNNTNNSGKPSPGPAETSETPSTPGETTETPSTPGETTETPSGSTETAETTPGLIKMPPQPPSPPTNSIKPIITESHTNNTIIATWKNVEGVIYESKLEELPRTMRGLIKQGEITDDGDNKIVIFEGLNPSTEYELNIYATKGSKAETVTQTIKTLSLLEEFNRLFDGLGININDEQIREHLPELGNIAATNSKNRKLTPEEQVNYDEFIKILQAKINAENATKKAAGKPSEPISAKQLQERLDRLLGRTKVTIPENANNNARTAFTNDESDTENNNARTAFTNDESDTENNNARTAFTNNESDAKNNDNARTAFTNNESDADNESQQGENDTNEGATTTPIQEPITSTPSEKTYYDILGIAKNSDEATIKKAYRTKVLKEHPNKGGDPENFKSIGEAYNILSDARIKGIYNSQLNLGKSHSEAAEIAKEAAQYTVGAEVAATGATDAEVAAKEEEEAAAAEAQRIALQEQLNREQQEEEERQRQEAKTAANNTAANKAIANKAIENKAASNAQAMFNSLRSKRTKRIENEAAKKAANNTAATKAIENKAAANAAKKAANKAIENKAEANRLAKEEANKLSKQIITKIKVTPEIANPLKAKLGQLKKNFSNLTRKTGNKTLTNRYQKQAKAVNNNMKRLTPGKNITNKNIENIKSRLANSYNSIKGGKRKTFRKSAALNKRKTMKKSRK